MRIAALVNTLCAPRAQSPECPEWRASNLRGAGLAPAGAVRVAVLVDAHDAARRVHRAQRGRARARRLLAQLPIRLLRRKRTTCLGRFHANTQHAHCSALSTILGMQGAGTYSTAVGGQA